MPEKFAATALEIPDVIKIVPTRFGDARGYFTETYSQSAFAALGIADTFVQDNHSYSHTRGIVRGLHFQNPPHAQGKLIRVTRGRIFDVAVDIRRGSPTYGKHVSAILTHDGGEQLWIPVGFAHGFCTLDDDTEISYKVTDGYAPECEGGILWSDPALAIAWPVSRDAALVSPKDAALPPLASSAANFTGARGGETGACHMQPST